MNISLKWFKEQIKTITKSVIENRIEKAVEELEKEQQEVLPKDRAYRNIKLVNNVLTIVLNNGDIITKENATEEDYYLALECYTEQELKNICYSENVLKENKEKEEAIKKVETLTEGIELLKELDDFIVNGNSVWLKGINRTLSQLLIERFINIVNNFTIHNDFDDYTAIDNFALYKDEEYIALKRFFMWCCLNPRAEVADKLYDFLEKNGMKITKQGFFVALRNVVKVEGADTELIHFITNAYNKIKAVWKQNTRNYYIYSNNNEYHLTKNLSFEGKLIGNLQDLYLNLPGMKENRYTDDWTRTFDIRIGKVVNMPIEECNWSTQDCAASGLHFGAHTAAYVLCGDTTVFTLHNPINFCGLIQ